MSPDRKGFQTVTRSRRFIRMLRKTFRAKPAKRRKENEVAPVRGCVLRCDLGLLLDHTGVYIGRGRIVSLNRHGQVRIETPVSFFPPGTNPEKSKIYTACLKGTDIVLASSVVAGRAKKKNNARTEYNVLFNNCHRFTCGCLTGDFENDVVSFAMLEDVLTRNIRSLIPKKAWWRRLWDFILRRKRPEPVLKYEWRPVKFG